MDAEGPAACEEGGFSDGSDCGSSAGEMVGDDTGEEDEIGGGEDGGSGLDVAFTCDWPIDDICCRVCCKRSCNRASVASRRA